MTRTPHTAAPSPEGSATSASASAPFGRVPTGVTAPALEAGRSLDLRSAVTIYLEIARAEAWSYAWAMPDKSGRSAALRAEPVVSALRAAAAIAIMLISACFIGYAVAVQL